MKIAVVIGTYDADGGGAERWTDRFTRWLLEKGHRVHVYARGFSGLPRGAKAHAVVDNSYLPWGKRLRFAQQVESQLRGEMFDIIHDMGDGWYADVFMPHHGSRAAGFDHNSKMCLAPFRQLRRLLYHTLPRYREFKALERKQYQPVQRKLFVALSGMVRQHMREYHNVKDVSLRTIYNGIDTEYFQPAQSPENRLSVRKQLGFTDERLFLLVAHNFRLKGLDCLLQALAKLKDEQRVGLIIAGNGQIEKYRRLAGRLGVEPFTRFVGNQSDPRPYYHASDVYVQPTFYDPCSLVVLEALACGLPVVTTRHNGVSELIEEGVQGFVLDDPSDAVSLADRMHRFGSLLVTNRASIQARKLAENYSFDLNCERLLDLYQQLRVVRSAA